MQDKSKILFIVPPNINYEDFVNPPDNVKTVKKGAGNYGAVITDIPLGILSLSAYVKKISGTQTRLLDFNIVLNKLENFKSRSFAEFFRQYLSRQEFKDYAPTIIGISALFSPSYHNILDIAQCCRKIFSGAIIVAGGGVPTNMYREIFRDSSNFDAFCFGEGEKPLLRLVEADDKCRNLEEDPSWITRGKATECQQFRHDFIQDLDDIPFYEVLQA